ncbi:MAG: RAD55 family ATPase [Nitrososphaeria archaeon]
MTEIERAKVGIAELDSILAGGLPRGSITLVAGGPGTGKTILAMQFIVNGATKYSEKGVFVTFNESAKALKQNMLSLGWNVDKIESEEKIKLLDFITMNKVGLQTVIDSILQETKAFGARRLVIDSITAISMAFSERLEARTTISIIQKLLRKIDCTTILIAEKPWGEKSLGSGVEEFVADGIILMETLPAKGELRRRMTVVKMRGTGHEMKFYQYTISSGEGIVITPYPEVV